MAKIRIANAPCSWGTLEIEGAEGDTIVYGRMLDELVDCGYTGTELGDWGYMPTDPAELHAELAQRELTLLGAFVPVALKNPACHPAGEDMALKTSKLLAAVAEKGRYSKPPFLVLADQNGSEPLRTKNAGSIKPAMALSAEEWNPFCHGANRIARLVKDQFGLPTVFHHHCAGYVETPDEIARFLDLTDPQALGLVFDTGHYAYGSGANDPNTVIQALDDLADRIWYVHFKDCHPEIAERARREGWDYLEAVRRGVFCELGQGLVWSS